MIKFERKTICFTRNRLRQGIVAFIAVVLILIVIFGGSKMFTSHKNVAYLGEKSQPIGVLNGAWGYEQAFMPEIRHIDLIEIRISRNDEVGNVMETKGDLVFQIIDPMGQIMQEQSVPVKDIQPDAYHRFKIDLSFDTEKTYRFRMFTEGVASEEAPTVWMSTNDDEAFRYVSFPGMERGANLQTNAQIRYSKMDYWAIPVCIVLIVLCALAALVNVHFSEMGDRRFTLAVLFTMPAVMYLIVEMLNNNTVFLKRFPVFILNYIFYLLFYILLFVGFNHFRVSTIAVNVIFMAMSIFNYFKLLWRGEPFQVWDVVTLQTAMNVSGNYKIELSSPLVVAVLIFILTVLITLRCKYSFVLRRTRISFGCAGLVLAVSLVTALLETKNYHISPYTFMQRIGVVNSDWNQPSNYANNGMMIALTMNANNIAVKKPDPYTPEVLGEVRDNIASDSYEYSILPNEALKKFEQDKARHAEEGQKSLKKGQLPNIICIMDESYTDMSSVGQFQTNLPMRPFMDSLRDNTIRGNLYVSVYGGGTANSEFEFLTGNSMSFFPSGSIPYQQYIEEQTGSLPRYLKTLGYSAIAVHPYLASGWNRPEVYQAMDFDRFVSLEDFAEDSECLRSYVTDRCSFEKLVELYEQKEEGKPIFLFNVTMQNHGAYKSIDPDFVQDVYLPDYPEMFPETEQYLSLARHTDEAVEYILDYFSKVDEPTLICFFGDHLPSMKNGFYEELLGKEIVDLSAEEMQRLYQTDYFIWANYDIPECELNDISLNYLSTLVLQTAGIELTDYNLLIAKAYEEYPILTTMGVYDSAGNRYNTLAQVPDESGILRQYNLLAYNNVFDVEEDRQSVFFDGLDVIPARKEIEESRRKEE